MEVANHDNSGFVFTSEEPVGDSPLRLTLMDELREAIKQDELVLYYQPKIASQSGRLCSVEALVRWEHTVHGFMPPDEFIPFAERAGLIQELTVWVLDKALEQCAKWHRSGFPIGISVNISALSLQEPEFPGALTGLLAAYDFPAKLLTIETTESSMMVNQEHFLEILTEIHKIGVRLSIDDFGTGYSSLSYIKKSPVSEIKIDKSFVMEMMNNESDAAIVKATIQLGHTLGLQVVAEGVEDSNTLHQLKSMGCDILQGYFIGQPMEPECFLNWIERNVKNRDVMSHNS